MRKRIRSKADFLVGINTEGWAWWCVENATEQEAAAKGYTAIRPATDDEYELMNSLYEDEYQTLADRLVDAFRLTTILNKRVLH